MNLKISAAESAITVNVGTAESRQACVSQEIEQQLGQSGELKNLEEEKKDRAKELIIVNGKLVEEISQRQKAVIEITKLNDELELSVYERTSQLQELNAELEESNAICTSLAVVHQSRAGLY